MTTLDAEKPRPATYADVEALPDPAGLNLERVWRVVTGESKE
jgi:hypothetical protein